MLVCGRRREGRRRRPSPEAWVLRLKGGDGRGKSRRLGGGNERFTINMSKCTKVVGWWRDRAVSSWTCSGEGREGGGENERLGE